MSCYFSAIRMDGSAGERIGRPRQPVGEVSEWPKEHAWKACVRVTVPRVRIPPSPFRKRPDNPRSRADRSARFAKVPYPSREDRLRRKPAMSRCGFRLNRLGSRLTDRRSALRRPSPDGEHHGVGSPQTTDGFRNEFGPRSGSQTSRPQHQRASLAVSRTHPKELL